MLNAIIIDDEKNSRDTLRFLLNNHCAELLRIDGEAASVEAGLELIEIHNPKIVFLDIQMNEETGFDLLERLQTIDFAIIFTTAFNNFALQAIRFSAIDYILKPIDASELRVAVEKAINVNDQSSYDKRIKNFVHDIKNTGGKERRMAVSTADGVAFIGISEILFCTSQGLGTLIKLKNGEEIDSSENIKNYEELLIESKFFRIHYSFLINLREVKQYFTRNGGHVVMSDNSIMEISNRRKNAFLQACKNLSFNKV
jgi:two-component system LytT family response regulator